MKPSERAAEVWFKDVESADYQGLAEVIAEVTGCDKGHVGPVVALWRQANPTPWNLNRRPRREGRDIFPKVEIRNDDGGIVMPLVDEGSIGGDTYAHIVACVNAAEAASASASVPSTDAVERQASVG